MQGQALPPCSQSLQGRHRQPWPLLQDTKWAPLKYIQCGNQRPMPLPQNFPQEPKQGMSGNESRRAKSREAAETPGAPRSPESRSGQQQVSGEGEEGGGRPQPLYLRKAMLHMPTHLLLRSCQGAAAQGTYLPFILLPPFHFPNPSCMEKQKIKQRSKLMATVALNISVAGELTQPALLPAVSLLFSACCPQGPRLAPWWARKCLFKCNPHFLAAVLCCWIMKIKRV